MLKLIETKGDVVTIFADTKDEVPATGIATFAAMPDASVRFGAGSMLYTSQMEIAFLKSDDNWNWV